MSPVGNTSNRRWRTGVPTQQGSEINTSAIKHNISCLSVTMVTEWEISTDIITPSDAVWCACAELMSLQHRFNPADHQINPGSGLTETSGGDQCRQNGTLLIDTHHYAASQSMFACRKKRRNTRALTAPMQTHTWHIQKTNTGSKGANAASLPVTPDAVGQLHESEGQV